MEDGLELINTYVMDILLGKPEHSELGTRNG